MAEFDYSGLGPDDMTLSDWLGYFDFGYEWCNEPNSEGDMGFSVVDYQGAYLGDIDDERFADPLELVGRFSNGSSYWIDYIDEYLEEEYDYDGDGSLEDEYQFALENLGPDDITTKMIYYALYPDELIVDKLR